MPLPDDPYTGKPFRYELTGDDGPPSRHSARPTATEPAFNIHYELTIHK